MGTMQTQNAWKPVKFDQYRSCSVSLEVTDLDEVEHRQIWSRGSGCPEGFHSHGRYWGWNNCWSHYAQKSNDDYVCFEVLGANQACQGHQEDLPEERHHRRLRCH